MSTFFPSRSASWVVAIARVFHFVLVRHVSFSSKPHSQYFCCLGFRKTRRWRIQGDVVEARSYGHVCTSDWYVSATCKYGRGQKQWQLLKHRQELKTDFWWLVGRTVPQLVGNGSVCMHWICSCVCSLHVNKNNNYNVEALIEFSAARATQCIHWYHISSAKLPSALAMELSTGCGACIFSDFSIIHHTLSTGYNSLKESESLVQDGSSQKWYRVCTIPLSIALWYTLPKLPSPRNRHYSWTVSIQLDNDMLLQTDASANSHIFLAFIQNDSSQFKV